MPQQIERAEAALLYDACNLVVKNVNCQPRRHKGGILFCGYADLEIRLNCWDQRTQSWAQLPLVVLYGNSIKLVGERVHFDPKSEKGKGARSSDYFPHWRPLTAEARAVLNLKLEQEPQIRNLVEQAVHQTAIQAEA